MPNGSNCAFMQVEFMQYEGVFKTKNQIAFVDGPQLNSYSGNTVMNVQMTC